MANNITLNSGTGGSTLATEQNGTSEHYQKIKIVDGTGGAFTNMAAVTANGLKVDGSGVNVTVVSADGGQTAIGATTDANTASTVIGRLKKLVSLLPTALGATTSANSLPVVIASDQAAVATTTADGGSVTLGAKADAKNAATDTTAVSLVGILKQISFSIQAAASSLAGTLTASVTQSGTWTVQPGNTANTTAWKTDGSAVTQPISAASLPLPSGAATSAKQPALGTAGTASADVLSVQGIASMTALKVDASATTQPVSGTITANQGTSPWVVQQSATLPVTLLTVGITASSSGDNTLIAAVASKKIYVVAWNLSFSGTVNAKFTDGASGTLLSGLYYGIANAGGGASISPPAYLWGGSTNTALMLNLSGATAVGGSVTYFVV